MSSSKPTISNPPNHPPFAPSYSHIATATLNPGFKIHSFAGQVGYDPDAGKTPRDLASQVKVALDNVQRCLTHVGAGKEDIVQVRQYVVGMSKLSAEDRKARADVYSAFMGDCRPPSTLLGVESLAVPELLYEVEIVTVVSG